MGFRSFKVQNPLAYFFLINVHWAWVLINVISLHFVAARKEGQIFLSGGDYIVWKNLGCSSISLWLETPSRRKMQCSCWAGNVQWITPQSMRRSLFLSTSPYELLSYFGNKKSNTQRPPWHLQPCLEFAQVSRVSRSHQRHVQNYLQWCSGSVEQQLWPHTEMCFKEHSLNFVLSAPKVGLVANLSASLWGCRFCLAWSWALFGFLNCNAKTAVLLQSNLTLNYI